MKQLAHCKLRIVAVILQMTSDDLARFCARNTRRKRKRGQRRLV
jgi:hypothetical protein